MTSSKNRSISHDEYRERYLKLRSVLHDRTTGLPAFPMLFDRLRAFLDDRRCIGVLHIEIENLELVESLYGWQVFDRILTRFVNELRACLGHELPEETLLGLNHVAGDRLVAFVPSGPQASEIDGAQLAVLGEAIAKRLEGFVKTKDFSGLSPKLGFRIGHALLSHNPFYRFERRVYSAVEEARAFDARKERRRELTLSEDLSRIIQDCGVQTVFQPVVDLKSREVLGFEAFARGPKGSPFEMPRAMFALSSKIGLSRDLDRICRDSALEASAPIAGRGTLFLNLLPGAVDSPELLERLAESRRHLVLEFSERNAGADPTSFIAALSTLKQNGFRVAVDDIGTGYASQLILEQVQPDYLKLDISLVRGIHSNLIKQELLGSLIRIARRIEARVIAEGVESREELETLVEAGADYGQGYFFAVPASAASVWGESGTKAH